LAVRRWLTARYGVNERIKLPVTHYFWMRLCVAVTLTVLSAGSAIAFALNDLVGQWFTELSETGVYQGEPYTIRKQIEDNRPDGTKTATFRFYDNCRYVGELINELQWGVDKDVYWTKCTLITQAGRTVPCSVVSHYALTEVTSKAMQYKSRETGTAYAMTKVDTDFKIPPSACLSAAPAAQPASLR
jgi:hypothetical protein